MLERIDSGRANIVDRSRDNIAHRTSGIGTERSDSVGQIVPKCAFLRRDRVGLPIPGRIEKGVRTASLRLADPRIVQQRIDPLFTDARVLLDIPGRIEQWIRPASLLMTLEEKMLKGVNAGFSKVAIGPKVIRRIE